MKRLLSPVVLILSAIAVLALSRMAPAQSDSGRTAPPIGTARIAFTHEHVENNFDVRAFVATDSVSPNCLVTMAESNFAVPGISMFCSPRIVNGQHGVLVSAFFPTPPPPDLILEVTLYHEFAHGYAQPVLYLGQ